MAFTSVLVIVGGTTNVQAATPHGRSAFGGYYASPAGVTTVSGDFVVPTVTCTTVKPQDLVSIVEISGGGLSTQAGANAGCQKGSPIYTAGGAAGLVTFHLPVSPGDVISVTATQSASGASVTETDTNSSLTATVSAPGAIATRVEVGNLFNREDVSIPTFSTESFSGAMVDGAAFGTVSYTETPMKGKRRKILISTGPLSSDGTSFTTTFVSP